MSMTSRDRLIRALRRREPDRVPMYFTFSPAQRETFERETGESADRYQEYFGFDLIQAEPDRLTASPGPASGAARLPSGPDVRVDEWGIGYRKGSLFHFEEIISPLRDAVSVSEVDEYPFPMVNPESGGYGSYVKKVRDLQDRGFAVLSHGAPVGGTLFWPAYKLRGMERLFLDMFENEALLTALLERVEGVVMEICLAKARAGVDVLLLADDFGTQADLMMSLPLWDRWFKDGLARIIARVKKENPDVIVAFHSDGAVQKLIPRLIGIGVDVLNPLQPECMDIVEVKRRYGDRLSFWGTIGTQTTMPFGTPRDVEEAVRHSIATVGKGGGLLIAPTHVLEPEVPWENIKAFVRAVKEFGSF